MDGLSWARGIAFPAAVGVLLAAGCFDEREGPENPNIKLGTPSGSGGFAAGPVGGSSAGGSGAAGGTTSTGGSTGTPDNCACILNLSASSACAACGNDAVGTDCAGASNACENDENCVAIIDCPANCPATDPAACIDLCFAGFPEASAELAADYYACICDTACTAECDGDNPTCEINVGGGGGQGGVAGGGT